MFCNKSAVNVACAAGRIACVASARKGRGREDFGRARRDGEGNFPLPPRYFERDQVKLTFWLRSREFKRRSSDGEWRGSASWVALFGGFAAGQFPQNRWWIGVFAYFRLSLRSLSEPNNAAFWTLSSFHVNVFLIGSLNKRGNSISLWSTEFQDRLNHIKILRFRSV